MYLKWEENKEIKNINSLSCSHCLSAHRVVYLYIHEKSITNKYILHDNILKRPEDTGNCGMTETLSCFMFPWAQRNTLGCRLKHQDWGSELLQVISDGDDGGGGSVVDGDGGVMIRRKRKVKTKGGRGNSNNRLVHSHKKGMLEWTQILWGFNYE